MFNTAQEAIDAFGDMSKQAAETCGSSHEVYIRNVSEMVDTAIERLSVDDQATVHAVAIEALGYLSRDEIAGAEALSVEQGYCCHGLTKQTCPCGCFEVPEDIWDEETTVPFHLTSLVPDLDLENSEEDFDVAANCLCHGDQSPA